MLNKLHQQGVAHLLLIIIILAAVGFGIYLVGQGTGFFPKAFNLSFFQKKPSIQLKTEYQNPFDKETQYVNPFEEYKNPFVVSK